MSERKRSDVSHRTSKSDRAKRPNPHAIKDLPAKPAAARENEAVKGGGGRAAHFMEDAG